MTQNTHYSPDVFYDKNFELLDKDVFGFETHDYFPLKTNPASQFYGNLAPNDDVIPLKEMHMSLNEVRMDDALFMNSARKKKYLQAEKFRSLSDKSSVYFKDRELLAGIYMMVDRDGHLYVRS